MSRNTRSRRGHFKASLPLVLRRELLATLRWILSVLAQAEAHVTTDPKLCPECSGDALVRDEVDIGVGIQYGPYHCQSCGWDEAQDDAIQLLEDET